MSRITSPKSLLLRALLFTLLIQPGPSQERVREFIGNVRDTLQGSTSVQIEYLGWWMKGNHLPPLVTTSTTTTRADAGVLGRGDTSILFGEQAIGESLRDGTRITFTQWIDRRNEVGIQLSGFSLRHGGGGFAAGSSGQPTLARPFIDATTGMEASELVAFVDPNPIVAGSVSVATTSEIQSLSAHFRQDLVDEESFRIDLLTGYRFFRFREGLLIQESLVSTDAGSRNQEERPSSSSRQATDFRGGLTPHTRVLR